MKIKIKDMELELRNSLRAITYYEQLYNKSLNFEDMNSISTIMHLFYAIVLATMQYNGYDLDITEDEFINWVDDNGGYALLTEFAQWYTKQMEASVSMIKLKISNKKDDEENVTNSKKSKNV